MSSGFSRPTVSDMALWPAHLARAANRGVERGTVIEGVRRVIVEVEDQDGALKKMGLVVAVPDHLERR
jgi:hypothetical protein